MGNAAAITAWGDRAITLTAAHVVSALDLVAGKDGPFKQGLMQLREVNPRSSSYLVDAFGERGIAGEVDTVDVRAFTFPTHNNHDDGLVLLQAGWEGSTL
jgi:hypothetical protein